MADLIPMNVVSLPIPCTPAEEKALRSAGYAPVVRWVHVPSRSDEGLKTIDALMRVRLGAVGLTPRGAYLTESPYAKALKAPKGKKR